MKKLHKRLIFLVLCFCLSVGAVMPTQASVLNPNTAEAADLPSIADESYVEGDVTVQISPLKDDDGQYAVRTETGKALGAGLLCYNDSPNATDTAIVRFFVEQTEGVSRILPESDEPIEFLSTVGNEATTLLAEWHNTEIDFQPEQNSADPTKVFPYLEVTLPAGASFAAEPDFVMPTGYDEEGVAELTYQVVTADGRDTYSRDDASSQPFELIWTGRFTWSDFDKKVSASTVGCTNDVFSQESLVYTFEVTDGQTDTGVIYATDFTLCDTLTLPAGISLPDDCSANLEKAALVNKDGEPVYQIHELEKTKYTLNSLAYDADGNTISFELKAKEEDHVLSEIEFNPVAGLTTELFLNQTIAGRALIEDESLIKNSASLEIASTVEGISYSATADAEVTLRTNAEIVLDKRVSSVKNKIDQYTYKEGETRAQEQIEVDGKKYPAVAAGDTVEYVIEVSNDSESSGPAYVTDMIPNGMTYVADSERVDPSGAELTVSAEDQTDGATKLIIELSNVPANGSVKIYYSCVVGEDVEPTSMLTNVATCGGESSESDIVVKDDGDYSFKKEIISRRTKTVLGSTVMIYREDGNSEIKFTGDIQGLLGTSWPSQAELEDALCEMNAGDYIEYLMTFENNSNTDITGQIYDNGPFYTERSLSSSESNPYYGGDYHEANFVYGKTAGQIDSNGLWDDSNADLQASVYKKGDFAQNAYANDWNYRAPLFVFEGDHPLKAHTTYQQTTVIHVPGDNTQKSTERLSDSGSSSSYSTINTNNEHFEEFVANIRYARTKLSPPNNNLFANAVFVRTSGPANEEEQAVKNGSSTEYCYETEHIDHSIAPQAYVTTGTLATTVVDDVNSIKSGEIREKVWNSTESGRGSVSSSDYENNANYFTLSDNEVIVNYVYLYNDSSEPMYMGDYNLEVYLPTGFEWLGLITPAGTDGDSSGVYRTYDLRRYSSDYVTQSPDYQGENYNVYVSDTACNSPFPYYASHPSPVDAGYYCDDNSSTKNGSVAFQAQKGNYSNSRTMVSSDALEPYSGIVLMYAVRVNEDACRGAYNNDDRVASFHASLKRTYNSEFGHSVSNQCMPQLAVNLDSRDYYADDQHAGDSLREYTANDGESYSYLQRDDSYLAYVNGSYGAVDASSASFMDSAYYLWSGVNLKPATETVKLSVQKDVVLNNGAEGDEYREKTEGFEERYDNYTWGYPLTDGIHRTVDGTVTWKTTVKNEGYSNYDGIAYGRVPVDTLVDTVDSPYVLREIYIPELKYLDASDKPGPSYTDLRMALPQADPSDVSAMEAAGWTYHADGDCFTMLLYKDTAFNKESMDSLNIRVTLRCFEKGSCGWGYDVSSGSENTQAYQYIVEFPKMISTYSLELPCENDQASDTLTAYLSFSTDDSIETNYNSFAVAFEGTQINSPDTLKVDVANNSSKLPYNGVHNGASIRSNQSLAKAMRFGLLSVFRASRANSDCGYANLAWDTILVQRSDWTDTSYTDGLKTMSYTDDDGVTKSIDSRTNGNMILDADLGEGDTIHNQLMVESILYESENYDYLDDLVIYDTFGVESDGLCGMKVDFDSLKVTDSMGNVLERGKDYRIEVTKDDLVVYEHHPLAVNTLTYAADIQNLDTASWEEYDGANGEEAHAFRLVMLDGGVTETIWNDKITTGHADWNNYKVFVDYDAEIREGVTARDISYPNTLAWTAQVHDVGTGEVKPFREDTTAAFFKVNRFVPTLSKSVKTALDVPVQDVDDAYTFVLLRTQGLESDAAALTYENVAGAAYVVVKSGESIALNNDNLHVFLHSYDEDDASAETFFNTGEKIIAFEIPTDGYTSEIKASTCYGYNQGTRSTTVMLTDLNAGIEDVDEFLSQEQEVQVFEFAQQESSDQTKISLACTNTVAANSLELKKVDPKGNMIFGNVTFQILDQDENALYFVKDASGCFNYAESTADNATSDLEFSGVVEVKGLPYGTYTLTETAAPEGYTAGADKEFSVGAQSLTQTISVENEPTDEETGAVLEVEKTDLQGDRITELNASFSVYEDADASEPMTFTRTEDGIYSYDENGTETSLETSEGMLTLKNLPYRNCFVEEVEAPSGYLAQAGRTEVELSRANSHKSLTVANELVSRELVVTKADAETGDAVADNPAVFRIQNEEGEVVAFELLNGSYQYSDQGALTDLSTDEAGVIRVADLPIGEYELVEVSAPTGYKIDVESTEFSVAENGDPIVLTITDTKQPFKLKIEKRWQLEGGITSYPMKDVAFTLYDKDTGDALHTGVTDAYGVAVFGDLDWSKSYYLYEEVPEGYSLSGATVPVFRDDATGKLVSNAADGSEGLTQINCIELTSDDALNGMVLTDDAWEYTENVLNVRNMVYGGLYGSTSYKTIDNAAVAEQYGIKHETGYSYFYTEDDYQAGNTNWVHALNSGDAVAYSLNVSNVSAYEFGNLVLIDRLPEERDTGVVNHEERDSEFAVLQPENFVVTIDGKQLADGDYSVSFSDKVAFTEADFNGTSEWGTENDGCKSFRIVLAEGIRLVPGQTLKVLFDGVIGEDAEIGEIAWNNFAYRYVAVDEKGKSRDVTLTPEPPKVGVVIQDRYTEIVGTKTFTDETMQADEAKTFTFILTRTDGLEGEVTYVDAEGKEQVFPEDGLTQTVSVAPNESGTFVFPRLSFSERGTYTFAVKEVIPNDTDGIVYDAHEENVVVEVSKLTSATDGYVEPVYESEAMAFENVIPKKDVPSDEPNDSTDESDDSETNVLSETGESDDSETNVLSETGDSTWILLALMLSCGIAAAIGLLILGKKRKRS